MSEPLPTCAKDLNCWAREARCAAPWRLRDGVPYCDTCGLFRMAVRDGLRASEMAARRPKLPTRAGVAW